MVQKRTLVALPGSTRRSREVELLLCASAALSVMIKMKKMRTVSTYLIKVSIQ